MFTNTTTTRKNSNRLAGKDLINVGIYSAIYFVIIMALAMTGYIPIMMPLLCVIGPLAGGIPFMLFLTKVKKFGMILIMSAIMGIMMALTGMGLYSLPVALVSGLVAELIWKRAKYSKASSSVLVCGFFNIWMWGNFIPLFINPDGYFSTRTEFGAGYEAALTALLPSWMSPVLLVSCFAFGILGGLLGRVLLKKHFIKAGIA
ncbi:energy-coupling factor transport system substrate-specific component [Ruminiclostridium sufflavum DSM 19573]|uniref:Energy-coupling factor transport system substrate-specific component n=1 Tax=Ruminiclostridium sufflavum DSM 19573 TaxID=1121337 RepID=A0A318XQ50_9FIRM|nr:MptD family putative ECF transporter S component [Ruminiclostridium sufflavum]PYG89398.1 energy-coupling factor transport system substrate-specific component [Ruminiclostridium sufflavum DSM 19573]